MSHAYWSWVGPFVLAWGLLLSSPETLPAAEVVATPEQALARSQAALGRTLGDPVFRDAGGKEVRLSQFQGKPLIITLIYTACSTACPLVLKTVAAATEEAAKIFGPDRFAVATIGFDTDHDTPERIRTFAAAQGLALTRWSILGGDLAAVAAVAEDTGFTFFPSPRGFDHIAQTTVIDGEGRVFRQIYGETFDAPLLVGTLRELLTGHSFSPASLEDLLTRIKLFCTVYDPARGRYRFSYAVFFELLVAGLTVMGLGVFVVRHGWRFLRQRS